MIKKEKITHAEELLQAQYKNVLRFTIFLICWQQIFWYIFNNHWEQFLLSMRINTYPLHTWPGSLLLPFRAQLIFIEIQRLRMLPRDNEISFHISLCSKKGWDLTLWYTMIYLAGLVVLTTDLQMFLDQSE